MGKYDDAAFGARASELATAANFDRALAAVAAELQLFEEKFSQEGKEAAEALRLAQVLPFMHSSYDTKESWSLYLNHLYRTDTWVSLLLDVDGQWTRTRNNTQEKVFLGTPANELWLQFSLFTQSNKDVVDKMSTNLDANERFEPDTLLPTAIANIGIVNGEFVTYDREGAPFQTLEECISVGIDDLITGRRRT